MVREEILRRTDGTPDPDSKGLQKREWTGVGSMCVQV